MNVDDKRPYLLATKLNNDIDSTGRVYLFNHSTNSGFEIKGLAAIFLSKFDGIKSIREIINQLETDFDLEKKKFDNDIEILVNDLKNNGLIDFTNQEVSD